MPSVKSSGLAAAWLFLSSQWEALRSWLRPNRAQQQLEVVHPGGAMLREAFDLASPEIALVHRGERVILLQEAGRRAHVRTGDGFSGWLSLRTAEGAAIARAVEVKVGNDPQTFREEFESKWRRLRVDVGPSEAPLHSLRQSSGRIPISQWRPGIKALSPQRPPAGNRRAAVPRLRPPTETPRPKSPQASASSGLNGEQKPPPAAVRPGEDLLDLEPKKEPPAGRWPDLAQILAAGSSPPTYRSSTDRDAGSGIPDAPPSRRESQFDTTRSWQEIQEEEKKASSLLSQLPHFEQLLDQQPEPEEVSMTFSYEMEDAHSTEASSALKVQQEIDENVKALLSQVSETRLSLSSG